MVSDTIFRGRLTAALLLTACLAAPLSAQAVDYRAAMIDFVSSLATHARLRSTGFGVFPQNAAPLGADAGYVAVVDGIGQEDLHYGYLADAKLTPPEVTAELESHLDVFRNAGKLVLTVDYPFRRPGVPRFPPLTVRKIRRSYRRSRGRGYVPYATVRNLNHPTLNPVREIPPGDEPGWGRVRDWGYQLQPARDQGRRAFLRALRKSPFDLLVIDYSFDGSGERKFTPRQVESLRDGGRRVLAYLSIGEAEDYRWYWQQEWDADRDGAPDAGAPTWLLGENPNWSGNYRVAYWDPDWQAIVFAYLDAIIDQGFDGVFLDIVDAYESFEEGTGEKTCPALF